VNIVRQALKAVKNQKEAILKVSPQDSQAVRDNLKEILSDGIVDYLVVVADSRLTPGTCILETDLGVIDASLDVQLEAIIGAFKKIMPKDSTVAAKDSASKEKENIAEENLEEVPSEVAEHEVAEGEIAEAEVVEEAVTEEEEPEAKDSEEEAEVAEAVAETEEEEEEV
jgi:hypothetical protein